MWYIYFLKLQNEAMATRHEILASGLLVEACPIAPEAVPLIADAQVRYRGTLGGNVDR